MPLRPPASRAFLRVPIRLIVGCLALAWAALPTTATAASAAAAATGPARWGVTDPGRPGPVNRTGPPGEPSVLGPGARAPATGWRPPIAGDFTVVRPFEVGPWPWSPGHRGVDIRARPGQPIIAPAGGLVVFAGPVAGRGVLVLQHAGGLRSSFEPAAASLPLGSPVEVGQPVGVLAGTPGHCAPLPCLHWGVRLGDAYLDPLLLLAPPRRIILLPMS